MSNNDLLLNYHDACVYRSDLAILKSPSAWLNDASINFFLTKLSQTFQDEKLKFVDPSVLSFFMHQWDEEEDGDEDVLGLKQVKDKLLFFLPINDNYVSQRWASPGGGIHWSLLLMILSTSKSFPTTFYHLDSSRGCNQRAASAVAEKLHRVICQWKKDETDERLNIHLRDKCVVQECNVPQQQNGYDCGIHTLAAAEALGKTFSTVESSSNDDDDDATIFQKDSLEDIVKSSVATSPSFCSKMRQRIAQEVEMLASSFNS